MIEGVFVSCFLFGVNFFVYTKGGTALFLVPEQLRVFFVEFKKRKENSTTSVDGNFFFSPRLMCMRERGCQ